MANKRARQESIPGTERAVHKDVRTKAEHLYDVRSQRMDLTKAEKSAADDLIAAMKKHGLTEHVEGDLTITLVDVVEKVRVKKAGEGEE